MSTTTVVPTVTTNGHSPAEATSTTTPKGHPPEPESFDLNAVIREELAESPDPNPHSIADTVFKRIPPHAVSTVLLHLLRQHVARMAYEGRWRNKRSAERTPAKDAPRANHRWIGAGQLYGRFLRERISVGVDWKFLGDCTRDDLRSAIAERMKQAIQTAQAAKRLERLDAAMEQHGASVVADLPETVLLAVLR